MSSVTVDEHDILYNNFQLRIENKHAMDCVIVNLILGMAKLELIACKLKVSSGPRIMVKKEEEEIYGH